MGESIGFWIGTAFFNPRQALVAASVILLTLMLLGGFFIRNIPSWVSWLRYLSNFKYANDASLGLVFDTNTPCDGSGLLPACQGQSTEETKEKQRQMVAASSDDEDGIEGSKMKLQLPATPEDAENGHAENGHAETLDYLYVQGSVGFNAGLL